MRVLPASEVQALSTAFPAEPGTLRPEWVEGPSNSDRLDVGVVTMSAGAATPPHVHLGGQVLVVTAGQGFIETESERRTIKTGDVVICPPGEQHVHGALTDGFAHLSVTTGGYEFPAAPPG